MSYYPKGETCFEKLLPIRKANKFGYELFNEHYIIIVKNKMQ